MDFTTFYKTTNDYLARNLPEGLSVEMMGKYFEGDACDFDSLEDVYEQLIHSAQNYQRMPNVIKYKSRRDTIKRILHDFDFEKIKKMEIDELYYAFRKEFNVTSTDSKMNSWRKWSGSIITAAKLISDFTDVKDFRNFVEQFSYNKPTRMALPLLISTKVSGVGFALACDFLKELGYTDYPKPDVHLIEVFSQLGFSGKNPMEVFEAIVAMSETCKNEYADATPYKIDKIIWLICSGNFYLDKKTIGPHKKDFISYCKNIENK